MTDQGDYTCYASNKFKDVEASGKLEVKGKTTIRKPPENFEVAADKSATFRCNADYDPSLDITIQWLFNGQPIDFDQDPRMVQSADNSLTITKTIELDSGDYTCVAKTELDQDTAYATLTVQGDIVVFFFSQPTYLNSDIFLQINLTHLECRVSRATDSMLWSSGNPLEIGGPLFLVTPYS